MQIKFLGACREVGRSCILIKSSRANILLDAGIKLGKEHTYPNVEDPKEIDLIVISHAHLDHIGYLPFLYKNGCNAKIISTKPTRDLAQVLLSDYLKIAKSKGEFFYRNLYQADYEREIRYL